MCGAGLEMMVDGRSPDNLEVIHGSSIQNLEHRHHITGLHFLLHESSFCNRYG
jgi:hypothetical protein